ncbi:hypothetical protein ACFQS7_18155 [Dankookia sp. GCM10030260]|uniref:hypothetical protein n=1 Tax=Dankookia sp. GCM10030260 TaxID=3273390 RepID=UPI0036174CD7
MTVTAAAVTTPALLPVPAGRLAATAPLLEAVLAALPGARGRAALLLPPRDRFGLGPARWRMAEAILQDAAATGGGTLLRSAGGGSLLLGASTSAALRAAAALGTLGGDPHPLPVWRLPRDADAVLAWAAGQWPAPVAPSPPAAPSPGLPPLSGLHQVLDGIPAAAALRAESLVTAQTAAIRGTRLRLDRAAIAAALGPLAADPDLLAHAEERMAARLLPGLAAWARDLPGLRLIPVARDRLPLPAALPGAVAVLPLALAADPGFPELRRRLAERHWALALEGLEAATLGLLDPRRLPADLLLLRWSPGLPADLAGLDPAKLLLVGARDPAALEFARAAGLLLAREPRWPPA